jgi:hypothetical protein
MAKEKRDPFKKVTENLPFYPDNTKEKQEPFFCVYIDETELGDDPDPKKHIPVFILADVETGEEVFCTQSYAIKKAIEAARKDNKDLRDVVFKFEFEGKTEVKGKPFNKFNTGYCSLEDYQSYKKVDEPAIKAKK